jgi:hypothetical protein
VIQNAIPGHGVQNANHLEEALGALEGLEVMHITEPCTFIVPPFCHAELIEIVQSDTATAQKTSLGLATG